MYAMSTFGDYKSYKKFAPQYKDWKYSRDLAEAKRQEYIRLNPDAIKKEDIQKSKALLRAIDIMDEFSQKRAEDMEVATESVTSMGLSLAATVGSAVGIGALLLKKGFNYFSEHKMDMVKGGPLLVAMYIGSGLLSSIAGVPLYNWGAKQEIEASRRGRFEAMKTELNDAKTFATLTEEQEQQLNEILSRMPKKKKSVKEVLGLSKSIDSIKGLTESRDKYNIQHMEFEKRLQKDKLMFEEPLSEKEIEDAKHDQQLLTKLIEKIDIASQDYAENAELATSTLTTVIFAAGALLSLGYDALAKKLKLGTSIAPKIIAAVAMLGSMIFSASIQKEAARVGRFKVKQDLLNHPERLVYISDEKTKEITDVEVKQDKKLNMLKFLKEAWKNDKEYKRWKENEGALEKATAKAMSQIDISEEQLKEAKRLQHNTFKTFNKIDANSQKYSESIEALGQSVQFPIETFFSSVGAIAGLKYFNKAMEARAKKLGSNIVTNNLAKYFVIIFLSTLPSIIINAFITKEQKKASRVADMMAIKELDDYRNFADYSDKTININS